MKKYIYTYLIKLCCLILLPYNLFALNPKKDYAKTPADLGLAYEAVTVSVDSTTFIQSWLIGESIHDAISKKRAQRIIIAHNGDGNMGDHLNRAKFFVELGFEVVMFDYRGFGASSSFDIDPNMYIYSEFQDDLNTVIDWFSGTLNTSLLLYGWGVGAGLVLGTGYNSLKVKHIVADAPFLSIEDLEERFASWEEPMEVPYSKYKEAYEPLYALQELPQGTVNKILLIIGENHPLFQKSDMERLQKLQPELISIYETGNYKTLSNFSYNRAYYKMAIQAFLER